nr:membrane dipeptidase [Saprospiraceae bacterium]
MNPIADIHAHPQLKPLNANEAQRQKNGIWKKFTSSPRCNELNFMLKGAVKDTKKQSQSNFDQAIDGDIKGVFLAMGPVERNFFDPKRKHWMLKIILQSKSLEDFAACLTGFDIEKVEKIFTRVREKRGIDYYLEELLPEYQFLAEQEADERMAIALNYNDFKNTFEKEGKIASLLTIEGAHSLGNYTEKTDFWAKIGEANQTKIYDRLMPHFENNITHMKNWGSGAHCPFFITFCHHFSNLLAGHAKSFSPGSFFKPGMDDLLDQRNGKNEGFSRMGWDVLELLTSKSNGRRVLIDVKHMSVKSRMEYFHYLEKNYWSKGEEFPVICSHGALNGYRSLEESLKPDKRSRWNRHYLSKQAINMSDEEAAILARSKGLFGIVLHGGRLPGGKAKKLMKKAFTSDEIRDAAVELIMSNIFHFVRAVGDQKAWDCIALGTDMDGVIEALPPYTNYSNLRMLPLHLTQFFHRPFSLDGIGMSRDEVSNWMFDLSPEQLTEKLMSGNVLNFLKRFFTDDYLVDRV